MKLGSTLRVLLASLVVALLWLGFVPAQSGADSATPSSSASPSASATATSTPVAAPTPVKKDNQIPAVRGLKFYVAGDSKLVTITAQLDVRIHINTLDSITMGLSLRGAQLAPIDPLFADQCTPLNSFSMSAKALGTTDLASLQKRSVNGDGYLESHVLTSVTTAKAGQTICAGEYVINTLALKDAAAHTLNFVASTSVTTAGKTTVTIAPSMTSNVWSDGSAAKLAAGFAVYPCPQVVGAAITARTICNQSIIMGQTVFILKAGADGASPMAIGQPIVDYQTLVKPVQSENERMKIELEVLNKALDDLRNRQASAAASESALPIVDYQAKAKLLQKNVDDLTKQLADANASIAKLKVTPKATPKVSVKATPKVTKKVTPKATPKVSVKATPKVTSRTSSRNQNSRRATTPPRTTWRPSPTPTKK